MKRGLAVACATLVVLTAMSKDIKYPVALIPSDLKTNANAVVREDEVIFRILSKKSSTAHYHTVVTILNQNGRDYAYNYIFYDKMRKVRDIKAFIYDAYGEQIKKLKSNEIPDRAAFDNVSLYSDNRYKEIDLSHTSYPYTIDLEYDLDYSYLFSIDGSTVPVQENVSVQKFTYQLIYPTELRPRYKAYNIEAKPVITLAPGTETMTWTLTGIKPLVIEPMAPRATYVQRIVAAPVNFEMGGYEGNMSSWTELGKWQQALNKGRDVLPEETKKKVQSLTAGLKTNEEKAKVIYEYLQSRTRYVSIQLGIGGLQPFDATTVDQTGYGDCKALSNYMVAMLKEVGVPAYYTWIYGGRDDMPVDPTFPSNMGNHIIVGVPNGKDTVWLECTNQTVPFGFVGSFTGNRYGLMITENGGALRKTTYYPQQQNVQTTKADVTMDPAGNAKATVVTEYTGTQYENGGLHQILNSSAADQKKWIQENTSIPSFDVGPFSFTNNKDKVPTATVKVDLVLNKYASVSNKRIFVAPNLMNRWTYIPEKVESRKTPFQLRSAFVDIDTIRYHLPENIYPEFLPPVSKISSRFGSYEAGYKLEQGMLIYYRKMVRGDGEFGPEAYQELIDFYKSINKADNAKIVFLNKT